MHKYLIIAEGIESMIKGDVFRIGDRLPSVRTISKQHAVNAGTVFQAFYHLEGKGLVEARPKSGYFVRFSHKKLPPPPTVKHIRSIPENGSARDMITSIFNNISAKDLINFSLGSPDLSLLPAAKLSKSVIQALRSTNSGLSYENIQGNVDLRKQLSLLALGWKGRVSHEDIIVSAGCMEAITLCLNAVVQRGDTVAVQHPAYFGFFQILFSLGLNVVEINVTKKGEIDLDALEKNIRRFKIKACMLVSNFNNPDGTSISDVYKKKIVQLLTELEVPLIEDDIYGELYFGKVRSKTCKSFDREGWVLYCSSFSKTLAPGYRVGWCIPGRYLMKVKQMKMVTNITGVGLTQSAIAIFLKTGRYEHHLKKIRLQLHAQYLRYLQTIIDCFPPDIAVSRPQGGFVLWIELNKNVNASDLYNLAIEKGVSVAPGQIFSSREDYSNYIRISYGKPYDETIESGLQILGALVKQLQDKRSKQAALIN